MLLTELVLILNLTPKSVSSNPNLSLIIKKLGHRVTMPIFHSYAFSFSFLCLVDGESGTILS